MDKGNGPYIFAPSTSIPPPFIPMHPPPSAEDTIHYFRLDIQQAFAFLLEVQRYDLQSPPRRMIAFGGPGMQHIYCIRYRHLSNFTIPSLLYRHRQISSHQSCAVVSVPTQSTSRAARHSLHVEGSIQRMLPVHAQAHHHYRLSDSYP